MDGLTNIAKLSLALSLLLLACGPRTFDGDCAQLDASSVPYDVGPRDDVHYRATSEFGVSAWSSISPPNDAGSGLVGGGGFFRPQGSRPVIARTVGSCREELPERYGPPRVRGCSFGLEPITPIVGP
jgi:hypothetical protein